MKRHWNEQDDEFLLENLQRLGMTGCAEYLSFTLPVVRKHAYKLGLATKINYSTITEEDISIVREYYPSYGQVYCASKMGKSRRHAAYVANQLKIKFIPPSIEDINEEEFRKFYEKNGLELTIKKFNLSRTRVRWWVSHLNLQLDKEQRSLRQSVRQSIKPFEDYKINPIKFLNPDTPEIAYILGYLWADGHVTKQRNSTLITGLERDLRTVEWVFDKIGIWQKRLHTSRVSKNLFLTFSVHNKYIKDFLVEHDYMIKSGASPDKILSIIPKENKHLFFRGFLDGDGSIISGKRVSCLAFSGPKNQNWNFIENQFRELGILNYTLKRFSRQNRNSSGSEIKVNSIENVVKFGDYIYSGYIADRMGLERKYNKFLFVKSLNLNKTFYRNIRLMNSVTGEIVIKRSVLDAAEFVGCGATTICRKMNKSYNNWIIQDIIMPPNYDFNRSKTESTPSIHPDQ